MLVAVSIMLISMCGKKEKLYEIPDLSQYKTDYVGDSSNVINIVSGQEYPEGYSYDSIEIQSETEPYGLTVFLKDESSAVKLEDELQVNADMTFDLIGNLGTIDYKTADSKEIMSNYDISTICYVANCGLNFTNESFRMVIHEILLCVIDIWKYTKRNYNAHEIFDVYQEHEIIELFQREMIQTQDDAKMAIDILFEEIDFTKFTTDTIEFYQDIFGNFLCEFFDSYVDSKRRNICKKKILYIEKKVNDIDEEYVRIQLYKSLMLSVTRYCTGDWSKIKTNYSYVDKQFLNKQFTKYGKYHIKELLRTIYQMHMDELLPEILISIRNSFQNAKSEVNKFKKSIREQEAIVQLIILKSFITYSDKIKQDQELIEAYEDILEILINLNHEQAAVILDEFRIH